MAICNMDCLNCVYPDCINNAEPTESEIELSKSLDTYVSRDRCDNLHKWDYEHSEKVIQMKRNYAKSDAGKRAHKRYIQSDKGKEAEKRHTQKQIKSGKNAEYCRRYYWKKKGMVV